MQRYMLKSKIHRAVVTHCELHYEGSCAIDEALLEAANILENERIDVWNINNGERFSTYAIKGERDSGIISLNGSAARRAQLGDLVIIATFANVDDGELEAGWKPALVFVDDTNMVRRTGHHVATQTWTKKLHSCSRAKDDEQIFERFSTRTEAPCICSGSSKPEPGKKQKQSRLRNARGLLGFLQLMAANLVL